ncbi:MAG: ankyrin repeat domain-containing protein [Myxococcaceae bacterium]|nr:ankyrin repeat domain-containing protein [Myxococcaceae bacterium]
MRRRSVLFLLLCLLFVNRLSGQSLLELIRQGQEQAACMLLAQNPNLAILDINQLETPLHLAAAAGMTRLVQALIGIPTINLDGTDGYGRTALMAASLGTNAIAAEQIIRSLIQKGANVALPNLTNKLTARHYALASELDLPLTLLDLLAHNSLPDSILLSETYQANGHEREARLSRLQESQQIAQYEQEKQENRWGKQYVKRLRQGEDVEGTPDKKAADRIAVRSAIRILDRIRELKRGDIDYDAIDIVRNALTLVSRLCYGLSKQTKEKYRATLLWPELEFLAAIFSDDSISRYVFPIGTTTLSRNGAAFNFRNHYAVTEQLLVQGVPRWNKQGDLLALRKRFFQMLSEYDQWGDISVPLRDPRIPESMLNLHAFIRHAYDLFSLGKIVDLTRVAARLNIEDLDERRRLFTIVKKVGDTAKYEMIGANLGRRIKAKIPEMSWESLQKLRNLLKEGPQKRPEVRARMNHLIRQGNIGGLSLQELRQDIVELGMSLKNILSGLIDIGEPSTLLDRIVQQHRSYLELSLNVGRRLSWLPEDTHKLARLLVQARQQSLETCLSDKQKQTLASKKQKLGNVVSHPTMPQDKKDAVVKQIESDIDVIEQELRSVQQKYREMLHRINGRNALRETDETLHVSELDTVCANLNRDDSIDFVQTYLSGSHYRSFETLSRWLDVGPTEGHLRNDEQQATYLRLAMDSWDRLVTFLFPDSRQRQRVLNIVNTNPRYLNAVNEDSRHLETCLRQYLEKLDYKVGLDAELIDFIIYSVNSGVIQNVHIRNILEHVDVMHEIHRRESATQVFNELISMLAEVDTSLTQRKRDLESKGHMVPLANVIGASSVSSSLLGSIVERLNWFRAIRYDLLDRHVSVSRRLGVPADGDCMFNAVLMGLHIAPETLNALGARQMVVRELRNNLHLYFTEIADQLAQNIRDNELDGYPQNLRTQMQNLWQYRQNALRTGFGIEDIERRILDFAEQQVPTYINAMEQVGQMWGGPIELGILARLRDVRIVVYNEGEVRGHVINQNATQGQVDLTYTGNHYELFRAPILTSVSSSMPCAW